MPVRNFRKNAPDWIILFLNVYYSQGKVCIEVKLKENRKFYIFFCVRDFSTIPVGC